MSHTADAARVHEARAVEGKKMEKAVARVRPGEGSRSRWVLGELVTHKIPSYQTGGAYSLFEVTARPGAGSPPHVQHREDESFCVLKGEFEFLLHGHTLIAEAGSLLYVPKGTLHAHRNIGEGVGRMLITQTPGGLYERFFEEVGKPVDGESGPLAFEARPEVDSIRALASEYGIEILPPIPTEA